MTSYTIVGTSDIITKELRRYILKTQSMVGYLRYTQTGNTFNVDLYWPERVAERWRQFVTGRFGV